jgi:hypothetical protein
VPPNAIAGLFAKLQAVVAAAKRQKCKARQARREARELVASLEERLVGAAEAKVHLENENRKSIRELRASLHLYVLENHLVAPPADGMFGLCLRSAVHLADMSCVRLI